MREKISEVLSHDTSWFNPRIHLDVKAFSPDLLGDPQSPPRAAPRLQALASFLIVLELFLLVGSTALLHTCVSNPFSLVEGPSLFSASSRAAGLQQALGLQWLQYF